MQTWRIGIVGGGASGLLAAVRAAQLAGPGKVLLLEAAPRVGRKLLATGNGRCNLENINAAPSHYHGDAARAAALLEAWPPRRVLGYLESLGLLCREEEGGRVYPYSLQASTVLNILRAQLQALGVEERCGAPVQRLRRMDSGFLLSLAGGETLRVGTLLLCTGGAAGAAGGTSGYALARQLGHSVTPLCPALAPIEVEEKKRLRPLKGLRARARLRLLRGGRAVAGSQGEVLFAEQALSGICVFELARQARPGDQLSLDLVPEYTLEALRQRVGGSLEGVLPKALAQACPFAQCKDFRFTVAGVAPLRKAQVTAGGVPLAELGSDCGSLRAPGAFLTGELLNIDGDCGGFNLHWAWATALAAAQAAGALAHAQ